MGRVTNVKVMERITEGKLIIEQYSQKTERMYRLYNATRKIAKTDYRGKRKGEDGAIGENQDQNITNRK